MERQPAPGTGHDGFGAACAARLAHGLLFGFLGALAALGGGGGGGAGAGGRPRSRFLSVGTTTPHNRWRTLNVDRCEDKCFLLVGTLPVALRFGLGLRLGRSLGFGVRRRRRRRRAAAGPFGAARLRSFGLALATQLLPLALDQLAHIVDAALPTKRNDPLRSLSAPHFFWDRPFS